LDCVDLCSAFRDDAPGPGAAAGQPPPDEEILDEARSLCVSYFTAWSNAGISACDQKLTEEVLRLVLGSMDDRWEQARYVRSVLRPFAVAHLARLRQLHREFGPGSALAAHGRYQLAGQPEALAVCERLTAKPMLLTGLWREQLPEVLLRDIAEAWGARIPG
jgi:hypothetical protein